MKIHCFTTGLKIPVLAIFLGGFLPLTAAEKIIIDTDFSKTDKEGRFEAVPRPQDQKEFPLKCPTAFEAFVTALPPSTSVKGTQTLDKLSPPYALINIKRKSDEEIAKTRGKPGFNVFGGFTTGWIFDKCPLEKGTYRISWTFVPLSDDFNDFNIRAVIGGILEDGTRRRLENIGHQSIWPIAVFASSDTGFYAGGKTLKIKKSTAYEVVVDFDLNANVWSVEVNGKKLLANMKFPESYLAEFKHFSVLGFHLSGGAPNWDSKMPDPAPGVESLYAVGKVKLVRLSD